MTSGTSNAGAFVAELIQSRNANASEALAILHSHMSAFKSRMAAVAGSRLNRAAMLVIAGVLGAILMMTVESRWVQSLPIIYTLSAIACIAAIAMNEPLVAAEVVFIGMVGECLEAFTFDRTQRADHETQSNRFPAKGFCSFSICPKILA